MKNCKRLFSCVLIVCMLLSLSPAIFAADDSDQPVNIGPGESVTVGNVTVTESGVDAVSASAAGGENSTLTVEGNVTQEGSDFYPVNAYTNGDGSTATVTVTGDVSGEGTRKGAPSSRSAATYPPRPPAKAAMAPASMLMRVPSPAPPRSASAAT